MKQVEKLIDRIISRVNINLREFDFDAAPYVRTVIPLKQMIKFYAFYGVTSHHPLHFQFKNSNLAGSYFLGKCKTEHAVLYKTDVRGDELKRKGDTFSFRGMDLPVDNDEKIHIRDSYLIKTLIHSNSHDPEAPEEFRIRNTISSFYANIHGAPMEGCYLSPFSTVDLTTLHSCIVGTFSYVQTEDLYHEEIPPGTIWIKTKDFEFKYTFDKEVLDKYINVVPGEKPTGILMDFVESRKDDFQKVFGTTVPQTDYTVPTKSAVNQYAYVAGETSIADNVLVAQRAYLDNAWMGPGTNAQENSYIVNSRLEKNDITAHGGKIINANLGEKVFVAFNSFLRGKQGIPLTIGSGSMVMPHTIIDLEEPLDIPERTAVWGFIRNKEDLAKNSIPLEELKKLNGELNQNNLEFRGNGAAMVSAFEHRIDHILEVNGAFFENGNKTKGHAQEGHRISFNTVQPYLTGKNKGIYPTMDIRPEKGEGHAEQAPPPHGIHTVTRPEGAAKDRQI